MSKGGFTSSAIITVAAGGGGAAPTFENTASTSAFGGASSLTLASFVITAANLLVVGIGTGESAGGRVVTGVTWNTTEALTKLTSVYDGNWVTADLWYLINPTLTTANVVVTWTGSTTQRAVGASGVLAANTSTPFGTPVTNTANANPATVTFSSATNELPYANVMSDDNVSITQDGTLLWKQEAINADTCAGAQTKTGAASITANWTQSIAASFSAIGVSIKS